MKKIILIALAVASISACSVSSNYIQTGAKEYPATRPSEVKIFSNAEIAGNYAVIGTVTTHTPGDGNKAATELKKEAAKIGANAIIAFELDKFNSIAQVTQAHGVAVRIIR